MAKDTHGVRGFTDTPLGLEGFEEESLGLGDYAQVLASFVTECDTPMTVALQGDWGSGKTSLMNLMSSLIKDPKGSRIKKIWFNTWQYSQFSQDSRLPFSLLSYFIDQLQQDSSSAIGKALMDTLKVFGKAGLNVAASTAKDLTGVNVQAGIQTVMGDEEYSATSLSKLKDNLVKLVEEQEKKGIVRIVVFIDDLDRLVPIKAVELLESLKLFLDIKKCVFVLAVDYHVVVQGLREKFNLTEAELKGRSFFDKIIQVPFNMPVNQYEVDGYFKNLMEKIGLEYNPGEIEHYIKLATTSVGFNPRTMKRIFNSLLLLKMVAERRNIQSKVSSADNHEIYRIIFAILCLQQAFPKAYDTLTSNISAIDDKLLAGLTDVSALKNEHAKFVNDTNSDDELMRLAGFMEYFVGAIQLKSDADDQQGEIISEGEIKALKEILDFSGMVGTETSDSQSSPKGAQLNREKLNKETFILQFSENLQPVLAKWFQEWERMNLHITWATSSFRIRSDQRTSNNTIFSFYVKDGISLFKKDHSDKLGVATEVYEEYLGEIRQVPEAYKILEQGKVYFAVNKLSSEDLDKILTAQTRIVRAVIN